jgi:putative transcriptional regulator
MGDPNFHQTVVLLLEWSDEGALGLVLNRPTDVEIASHLPSIAQLSPEPRVVHVGGPVQTDVAIGLDVTPGVIPELVDVSSDLVSDRVVRVFAGYAGWGSSQLDQELAMDAWHLAGWQPADLAAGQGPELWRRVLRRQPGTVAFEALFPDDLTAN